MEAYGRRVVLDLPFELTLAEAIRALHDEMLEVVGRLDVREFLNRTIHHDFRR